MNPNPDSIIEYALSMCAGVVADDISVEIQACLSSLLKT